MNIPLKVNQDFEKTMKSLSEKYGEDFEILNGFHESQLNHSDFIDVFVDKNNKAADITIDANANASSKDVRSLLSEKGKSEDKLFAFNKIFYELKKKYGLNTAREWLETEYSGGFYLHDAPSATYLPYCYKPEEMLTVSFGSSNNPEKNIYSVTFKELYNFYDCGEEKFDISINQMAKFPKNLYVLDIVDGKEIWTKINRIVRHNNEKPMRFIKYANGISQIVTEDHPVITKKGDVPAKDVSLEDEVFSCQPSYFKPKTNEDLDIDSEIILNKDIGWITGLALSEGSFSNNTCHIAQQEEGQRKKLANLCEKYNIPVRIDQTRFYLHVSPFQKFLNSFMDGHTSEIKCLPSDYNNYPDEFLQGVVAGMIDGDGTLDGYKHRHCQIRITSEQLIHQLSNYLQSKGIFCCDRIPHMYKSQKSFNQKLPMFGIGFPLTNENFFSQIGSIKIAEKYEPLTKKGNFKNKRYDYSYGWVSVIENVEYIDKCAEVYDITTETGHFLCNNIVSHNCYAYDLTRLATEGLFFLKDYNAQPPKHLTTFIDDVVEYVSYYANRSSGEQLRPLVSFRVITRVA